MERSGAASRPDDERDESDNAEQHRHNQEARPDRPPEQVGDSHRHAISRKVPPNSSAAGGDAEAQRCRARAPRLVADLDACQRDLLPHQRPQVVQNAAEAARQSTRRRTTSGSMRSRCKQDADAGLSTSASKPPSRAGSVGRREWALESRRRRLDMDDHVRQLRELRHQLVLHDVRGGVRRLERRRRRRARGGGRETRNRPSRACGSSRSRALRAPTEPHCGRRLRQSRSRPTRMPRGVLRDAPARMADERRRRAPRPAGRAAG